MVRVAGTVRREEGCVLGSFHPRLLFFLLLSKGCLDVGISGCISSFLFICH